MKIDMNSWHYRWFARKWGDLPRSLCWYFWKVVLNVIGRAGGLTLGAAFLLLAAYIVFLPLWQWFLPAPSGVWFVSLLAWVVIGIWVPKEYREYLYDSDQLTKKIARAKPQKPPSLLVSYMTAQHRKVCPLLEYTYTETTQDEPT